MKRGFYKRIGKVCVLVAATSMLPLLAYADKDKDKGKEDKDRDDRLPVVPEVKYRAASSSFGRDQGWAGSTAGLRSNETEKRRVKS